MAAARYRQSFALMVAIARCESGIKALSLPRGRGGSSGLMQFMPDTWAHTPYARHWILSARYNALAGAWLLAHKGTGPWIASRPCWG